MKLPHTLCIFALVSVVLAANINVDVSRSLLNVSPKLFGLFFEEINHAGDGGLYAELIQNRAFDANLPKIAVNQANTSLISLKAITPSGEFYIRHCDYLGYISHISSDTDDRDSSFILRPGLADPSYVSFESLNYPGYFLRHADYRFHLEENDGSTLFQRDASFKKVQGLSDPLLSSFESYDYPGWYIAWNTSDDGGKCAEPKYNLWLLQGATDNDFKKRATFSVESSNFDAINPWKLIEEGSAVGGFVLDSTLPLNNITKYSVKITAQSYKTASDSIGIYNPGYWGISVTSSASYDLSFYARGDSQFLENGKIVVSLESSDGSRVYARDSVIVGSSWKQYKISLTSSGTDSNARFTARLSSEGTIWLTFVSLFPKTWNNQPNGLRVDLAEMLYELNPSFVRFPGGTYILGTDMADAYQWKETIGPLEERPGHYGFWGYWVDDGLGYYEYLVMCEQLGAAPLFVSNIGLSTSNQIPVNQLEPWIQDALDAIEFANGGTNTVWGSMRAKLGHPAPFNMTYMALGNENCGTSTYVQHYTIFANRIKAQYPYMQLVANCDISKQAPHVDLFDYHVYSSPQWFIDNRDTFDRQDRKGPQVFVSEYAVTNGAGQGNLIAAVSEAAFMTGLIKNSDIVTLASYAPLFVNVNNRAWNPDAIQFNSSAVAGTPSYYVQLLFGKYRGDKLLYSVVSSSSALAVVSTYNTAKSTVVLTVVNYSNNSEEASIQLSNGKITSTTAQVHTLTSGSPNDQNTLDEPFKVVPKDSSTNVNNGQYSYTFPAYSVVIFEISASR
eukprot:TRINITY_DN25_c0_g1_i1.p1 TRINITY_DN25_c0_g1~~TRINITY_DN25_c0_g1_i1.p1  ORF type:complete len:787 (-),score=132.01 TRINITY_DN25_c0_g1_i1:79-2439(-)